MKIELHAVEGLPRIEGSTDPAAWVVAALASYPSRIAHGDIVVVAHKVVSKAEGRVVALDAVQPGDEARTVADVCGKDPDLVEVILSETREILRSQAPHLITEHRLGFICANAAVDQSNAGGPRRAVLLPLDPDASAHRIREAITERFGARVAVVISDTHGRPFRVGAVGVAVGVSGIDALRTWRGECDLDGRTLEATEVAVADEIASAASLLMGQGDEGRPIVIVRGFPFPSAPGRASDLVRPRANDLFR